MATQSSVETPISIMEDRRVLYYMMLSFQLAFSGNLDSMYMEKVDGKNIYTVYFLHCCFVIYVVYQLISVSYYETSELEIHFDKCLS